MENQTNTKHAFLLIAIAIYAIAMTVANLLVAKFGPAITPVNAFVLIGLDLALRDWLHFKLKPYQMAMLIAATGVLTFVLNPDAGRIAVASAMAFTAAAVVDWGVFAKVKGTWFMRSNASNAAGAIVDSLVFPTIAFGALMPTIIASQFVAKVVGGAVWAYLLKKRMP